MKWPRKLVLVARTQLKWGWRLRSLGPRSVIGRAKIIAPAKIALGNKVLVDDYAVLNAGGGSARGITVGNEVFIREFAILEAHKGWIDLGDHCFIGPHCTLYGQGGLKVGKHSLIGAHTVIIPSQHNFASMETPYDAQGETSVGVTIGDNCWIGANCTVLDGVQLGDNTVVAAGAVVTKSFGPDVLLAGVPAKVIKKFDRKSQTWRRQPS